MSITWGFFRNIQSIGLYNRILTACFVYWLAGEFAVSFFSLPGGFASSTVGNFATFGLIAFLSFCFSGPSRKEILVVVILSVASLLVWPGEKKQSWSLFIPFVVDYWAPWVTAGVVSVVFIVRRVASNIPDPVSIEIFLSLVFGLLYGLASINHLLLTVYFHPTSLDFRIFSMEAWLLGGPSIFFNKTLNFSEVSTVFFVNVYASLPFVLQAVYLFQIKTQRINRRWEAVSVWFVLSVLALLAYHVVPVMGPKYAFGINYPDGMARFGRVYAPILTEGFFKNGVPSMHFGWAYAFWFVALGMRRTLVSWFSGLYALLVGLSTFAVGEHYLFDLVVACPFVVGILAVLARIEDFRLRKLAFLFCSGLYVLWVVLIRVFYDSTPDWLVGVACVVSFIVPTYFGLRMAGALEGAK